MKLSKHSDYSLRVLIFLTIHPDELCQISEICDSFRVTKNNMIKVVNGLAKIGFIETFRGQKGGIRLKVNPESISVGEILRKTENSLNLIDCAETECPILRGCNLKKAFDRAMNAFLDELDRVTLSQIAENKSYLIAALAKKS